MSFRFEATNGLIIVQAAVWGPTGDIVLQMALDTGATRTLINATPLVWLGYDLALSSDRVEITTASGVDFAPLLIVEGLAALGQHRKGHPVVCHTLPPSANVDGVLGLDFLRGQSLLVDFRKGELMLS